MTIYKLDKDIGVTEIITKEFPHPLVIALGNFDGVHIGHCTLLRRAAEYAEANGLTSAVWTFERRNDGSSPPFLTEKERKLEIFMECGISFAFFEDFELVRDYSPMRFVRDVLISSLNCSASVCGFNYRFGMDGAGDADLLCTLMNHFGSRCIIVPPVKLGAETISSTLIRRHIASGDMKSAQQLLGRPYSIRLPVEQGKKLGRRIGVPTINQLLPSDMAIPRFGVYAAGCKINGTYYRCVTNIGKNPTVGGVPAPICESHIIGFEGDLYGQTVEIYLYRFLRGEQNFETVERLKNAINIDINTVKTADFYPQEY